MKSYKNHLIDTSSFGEQKKIDYRPVMRSSAIFPLILRKGKIESFYTFMGYWLRKRKISLVTALFTLRDSTGKKINVMSYEVNSTKSYVVRANDLFLNVPEKFDGSVEIEIFSAIDMAFPYPAITFGIKGLNGTTYVHTCGRIYNDFDDLNSNNEISVPETGFDILLGKKYKPFFCFVNGPVEIANASYDLEFIDQKNQKKISKRIIKKIPPFGLAWLNIFDDSINFDSFSDEKISVKIKHSFSGFFPRFVAGNVFDDFSDVSLTHTYYDNSFDNSNYSKFKNPSINKYHDSSIAVPYDKKFNDIELAIYPNFSEAPSILTFELYDASGKLEKVSERKITIADGATKLTYVSLFKIFSEVKSDFTIGMVKIIVNGNGTVPSRIKFGLNLIKPKGSVNLPSNICFNANVPNEKLIKKPGTFKWCPILSAKYQKVYIHNSGFVKKDFGTSKISIELSREIDNKKIAWSINIPENGTIEIIKNNSEKIDSFLNGSIGWIALDCSSPFICGYYVNDYDGGVVGADHLF
jgi:hypothetical protein